MDSNQSKPSKSHNLAYYCRVSTVSLCAAVLTISGCQWLGLTKTPPPPPTSNPTTTLVSESPLFIPTAGSMAVATGPLPQVYLLDLDQTIRVVDLTSNALIVTLPVQRGNIIRVVEGGVFVGKNQVAAGPLKSKSYSIEIVHQNDNVIRQTTDVPTGTPPPADGQPK
jgi:hypothetical protein